MRVYIDVLMLFVLTVIKPGLDAVQPGNAMLYTEGQMVSLHVSRRTDGI